MTREYSYYPLTYPQQNIFKTEMTYRGTNIGTIATTISIVDENIDYKMVEKALNLIIEHNDAMRARIKMVNREPRQYFIDYQYEMYDFIDFSDKPEKALFEYDTEQTKIPFMIIDSPLYYFSMIKLSDNEIALFSKMHHLITDAWAIVHMGNLLVHYYEKLIKGEEIDFSNIPSYNEYILDESQYLVGNHFDKDKEFWSNKFSARPEQTILKSRKSKFINLHAKRKTFLLPDRLAKQLRLYCKNTKTSVFAVILSAFAIYIKRTTHKDDIIIGTPVLNRSSRRQNCRIFSHIIY